MEHQLAGASRLGQYSLAAVKGPVGLTVEGRKDAHPAVEAKWVYLQSKPHNAERFDLQAGGEAGGDRCHWTDTVHQFALSLHGYS